MQLEDEDMEEIALIGWNLIGNKNIKLYRFSQYIDPIDNSITLPCNALINGGCVEAVTASYEDWERVSNKKEWGDLNSAFVEHSIEAEKYYQGNFYIPGKLLKYQQVGDKLYFTHNYGKINVLYKGVLVDEDGLPELTDKEANALATFVAYTQKYKEGLLTNNPNITKQASELYQLWSKQCDQARITYLNQNDMNNILDIIHSWDRHNYNKSTKILK